MGLGLVLQEKSCRNQPSASGGPARTDPQSLPLPQAPVPQRHGGPIAAGSPVSLLLLPCPLSPLDAALGAKGCEFLEPM